MKIWTIVGMALLLGGCSGEEESEAADDPEPVRPVEVVTDEGEEAEAAEEPDDDEEIGRLRARVSELEAELATCRQQAAAVPTGVDPQPVNADPEARRDAGPPRDAGPRRRRDDETIRLPDPFGILNPR